MAKRFFRLAENDVVRTVYLDDEVIVSNEVDGPGDVMSLTHARQRWESLCHGEDNDPTPMCGNDALLEVLCGECRACTRP